MDNIKGCDVTLEILYTNDDVDTSVSNPYKHYCIYAAMCSVAW